MSSIGRLKMGGGAPPEWCRQTRCRAIARHGEWCRPTGRRKTAWQRPGSKPAAALLPAGPIGPAGMVPPDWAARRMVPAIAGTVWCRPIGRHGEWCRLVWCRQSAARSMVPPNGAARFLAARFLAARFWAAGNGAADWRTVLAGAADRNWGLSGRDAESGNAGSGNADVRECGAWECGAWGKCGVRGLPAGPIGPAGTVPGNCPARSMVPPDRAAQNGAAYWRHLPPPGMVPPIGGTVPAAAGRAAGRSAGGKSVGGRVVPPTGGMTYRLLAARCHAVNRRRGVMPPIGGAEGPGNRPAREWGGGCPGGVLWYRRADGPGGCPARPVWCRRLAARFRAGPSWCRAV